MKISDLRACDCCGSPVGFSFYVLRVSMAIVKPNSARQVFGLTAMLGGSLALSESFAPGADDAVIVLSDQDSSMGEEIYLCQECYILKAVRVCELAEIRSYKKAGA